MLDDNDLDAVIYPVHGSDPTTIGAFTPDFSKPHTLPLTSKNHAGGRSERHSASNQRLRPAQWHESCASPYINLQAQQSHNLQCLDLCGC